MAKKVETTKKSPRSIPRAFTPEGRENQLIALAVDLAEKQLREGTASSQVITHYLKLGTTTKKIENEILQKQSELLTAKTESIKAAQRVEELYAKALDAMRSYQGKESEEDKE